MYRKPALRIGVLLVPRGRSLVPRSQVKGGDLIPRPRDHLQADRQPVCVETARHADRRQTVVVGEDRVFGRERPRVRARTQHRRDGRRDGWKKQYVEVAESLVYGLPVLLDAIQPTTGIAEGYGRIAHGVAEALDDLDGFSERGHDLGVGPDVFTNPNPEVSVRHQATGVAGLCPSGAFGHDVEHKDRIVDTACGDPDMVEPQDHLARSLFAFEDARGVDQAVSTLETDDATTRGR